MAQSENAAHGDTTSGDQQLLRAQLAIEPHPDSNCAVVNTGETAHEVNHDLKVDPSPETDETLCGECHTELAFEDGVGTDRTYIRSSVTSRCICPVFQTHDCIPRMRAVRAGALIVVVTVPARETLRAIISDLRRIDASVSVDWLVCRGEDCRTVEIDVSSITDKQQEALELAKSVGYYETPRQADLGEIASELGISESAASQRLNAAETKLVTSFLEE